MSDLLAFGSSPSPHAAFLLVETAAIFVWRMRYPHTRDLKALQRALCTKNIVCAYVHALLSIKMFGVTHNIIPHSGQLK